jgi:hypothetical protein
MQVVRAIFDGKEIKPIEPIKRRGKTEVLVVFPDDTIRIIPEKARVLLRGRGKGEMLNEKLLKSRAEDIRIEGN